MKHVRTTPLKDKSLYIGGNGEVFCGALRCAGNSAHHSARTIGGADVLELDASDYAFEKKEYGEATLDCEACGRKLNEDGTATKPVLRLV